jgi:hypothetical protein
MGRTRNYRKRSQRKTGKRFGGSYTELTEKREELATTTNKLISEIKKKDISDGDKQRFEQNYENIIIESQGWDIPKIEDKIESLTHNDIIGHYLLNIEKEKEKEEKEEKEKEKKEKEEKDDTDSLFKTAIDAKKRAAEKLASKRLAASKTQGGRRKTKRRTKIRFRRIVGGGGEGEINIEDAKQALKKTIESFLQNLSPEQQKGFFKTYTLSDEEIIKAFHKSNPFRLKSSTDLSTLLAEIDKKTSQEDAQKIFLTNVLLEGVVDTKQNVDDTVEEVTNNDPNPNNK